MPQDRRSNSKEKPMHGFIPVAAGLALLSLTVATSATDEKTVTITDKDKDAKIELAKGDKLLVKLPANPTTGFTWMIAKEADKLKSAGKPDYEPADKDKKVVGGGGTQIFTFTAQAAGEVEMELQYKRPFEKDKEPAKTYKFKVTIK
jgi:inhibitor of cysteine peptidase